MARIAMFFGVLLIALSMVGYLSPDTFGSVGPEGRSPTALIPAGFGVVLLLCGIVVEFAPKSRKHMMHLAALVALLGAVGGIMPIRRNEMDFSKSGTVAGLLMVILCAIFVILCVRSFVLARVARSEGLPEVPWAEDDRARQKPRGA
jgi:hypothetical protein